MASDQQHGRREPVDVDVVQVEAEHLRPGLDVRGVQADEVGAEDEVQHPLDDDRYRVGGEQRHRGALPAAQRPDEGPLDRDPDEEHRRDGHQQADKQVDVQVHGQHVAEVRAEHDQDALGDVDDVEHAEDQRQPDRHQRVDTAAENAVDDGFGEFASHPWFMPFILLASCDFRAATSAPNPLVTSPSRLERSRADGVGCVGQHLEELAVLPLEDERLALRRCSRPRELNLAGPCTVCTAWVCR